MVPGRIFDTDLGSSWARHNHSLIILTKRYIQLRPALMISPFILNMDGIIYLSIYPPFTYHLGNA